MLNRLKAYFITLFLIGPFYFASRVRANDRCDQELAPHIININVDIPANKYTNIKNRTLDELANMLTNEFIGKVNSVSHGARVFDAGGGYSFYGIQLAQRGLHVTTVSRHDFYSEIVFPLINSDLTKYYGLYKEKFFSVDKSAKLTIAELKILKEILGIEMKMTNYEELTQVFIKVKEKILDLQKMNRFVRKVAFVENTTPFEADNSVDIYIDAFGAFQYSSDRWAQLKEAYRILKPGGMGFFYSNTETTIRLGKDITTFFNYLARQTELIKYDSDSYILLLHKPIVDPPKYLPGCYEVEGSEVQRYMSSPSTRYKLCEEG